MHNGEEKPATPNAATRLLQPFVTNSDLSPPTFVGDVELQFSQKSSGRQSHSSETISAEITVDDERTELAGLENTRRVAGFFAPPPAELFSA